MLSLLSSPTRALPAQPETPACLSVTRKGHLPAESPVGGGVGTGRQKVWVKTRRTGDGSERNGEAFTSRRRGRTQCTTPSSPLPCAQEAACSSADHSQASDPLETHRAQCGSQARPRVPGSRSRSGRRWLCPGRPFVQTEAPLLTRLPAQPRGLRGEYIPGQSWVSHTTA